MLTGILMTRTLRGVTASKDVTIKLEVWNHRHAPKHLPRGFPFTSHGQIYRNQQMTDETAQIMIAEK